MKIFGLIGRKLEHSFSARYFNEKFRSEGLDAEYLLYESATINDCVDLFHRENRLCGLNVTIPYKREIIPFLDGLSSAARRIGAVNTIKFERDYKGHVKRIGYNTDRDGFLQSISPIIDGRQRALVLGQGGASLAVKDALCELGVEIKQVSRRILPDSLNYKDLSKNLIHSHEIIVNCTPLGMFPDINSYPDIPYQYLTPRHLCFDLVYNPEITEFMRRSKAWGATIMNGSEMLRLQAEYAWNIWNRPTERRYLTNHLKVIREDKLIKTVEQPVVVTISTDSSGKITEYSIQPFLKEEAGIEYKEDMIIKVPF